MVVSHITCTLTDEQWEVQREQVARDMYEKAFMRNAPEYLQETNAWPSIPDASQDSWCRCAEAAMTALGFRRES